ncbi:hypothetical protein BGW80DRAFT_807912 [Lactifluus volemus]|nr:hypothetical protein BGW80DRAFT_807912 [Lactifluus volemus]
MATVRTNPLAKKASSHTLAVPMRSTSGSFHMAWPRLLPRYVGKEDTWPRTDYRRLTLNSRPAGEACEGSNGRARAMKVSPETKKRSEADIHERWNCHTLSSSSCQLPSIHQKGQVSSGGIEAHAASHTPPPAFAHGAIESLTGKILRDIGILYPGDDSYWKKRLHTD